MKKWVVRMQDGRTVADILRKMNENVSAVDDGRVFIGKKRVEAATERVAPGDELHIGPIATSVRTVQVLFDDDGLLACIKPSGIPTIPDHSGSAHALVSIVARQTKRTADTLRITSRLDREVSGVVVFATTAEAEERLRLARDEGTYHRRYVAIACGALSGDEGVWNAPIGDGKDPRHRAAFGPNEKAASTRWKVVKRSPRDIALALLAVEPITGRTHQIRVHAAHAKVPLFGDRDYGGPGQVVLSNGRVVGLQRIALHCARVRALGHLFQAPMVEEMAATWRQLGGGEADLDEAVNLSMSKPSAPPPRR